MSNRLKISLLLCCLFGLINIGISQKDTLINSTFQHKLREIKLLTNTQQYSEAMRRLKALENNQALESTMTNKVDYQMMLARVLRLSGEFDDAMDEIAKIPNLENHKKLKLEVDFRRAALYLENPKYSVEERMKIVYPIIEEGIKIAKELNSEVDLAAFFNLKACIHIDECNLIQRECEENRKIAVKYFRKSMDLFLSNKDTSNYHNVLNGLFRLSIGERTADLDSLRDLVIKFTEKSTFAPNVLASRNRLATYYIYIHNDSLNYLKQTILEKNAMIDAVNKNADNAIGKLKLLYEFDSLKADLDLNKGFVTQKDLEINEKNKRIVIIIIFSVVSAILTLISIFLFVRQRKLARKLRASNSGLQDSNHNYQLLIKESNHRIKNNLQMILSILALEKNDAVDEESTFLTNISSKILTIAALHRILDFKEHNEKVELRIYFKEIIQYFEDLSKNEIEFVTDFANPRIESERIVYFGLVFNELISNTLEHRKSEGEIVIQVLKSEKHFVFIYRDNSNFGNFTKSNGMVLIENLIGRFGGVQFKFNPDFGEYKFYFYE